MPERFGPIGTVSSRFYRWRQAGIWQRVLEALQAKAEAAGLIEWDLHFVDSSVVRAHQHAAGARRSRDGGSEEALGRSRGGFSTKIHVRAEGYGKPVSFALSGGERHDSVALPAVLDGGAVRRRRGRPRLRPRRVAGDKAFSGRPSRQHLRRRPIGAVIPTTAQQRRRPVFDRAAYRARNRVERLFNRLKQFRRIATRYEKRAANFLAMLHIAAILIWIKPFADTA